MEIRHYKTSFVTTMDELQGLLFRMRFNREKILRLRNDLYEKAEKLFRETETDSEFRHALFSLALEIIDHAPLYYQSDIDIPYKYKALTILCKVSCPIKKDVLTRFFIHKEPAPEIANNLEIEIDKVASIIAEAQRNFFEIFGEERDIPLLDV